jgi:hypothetical protein
MTDNGLAYLSDALRVRRALSTGVHLLLGKLGLDTAVGLVHAHPELPRIVVSLRVGTVGRVLFERFSLACSMASRPEPQGRSDRGSEWRSSSFILRRYCLSAEPCTTALLPPLLSNGQYHS